MSVRFQLIRLLNVHGVTWKIDGTRLYADDHAVIAGREYHDWLDVSDWTVEQLYHWLGY